MRSAATGRSERLYVVSGRLVLISIGMFSACWCIITFPVFWRDARLDLMADRILDGEQFKHEILQIVLADADSAESTRARPEASEALQSFGFDLPNKPAKMKAPSLLAPYSINSVWLSLSDAICQRLRPIHSFGWRFFGRTD